MQQPTTSSSTDSELIAACLGGSEAAWSSVVDRYGRLVYSVARRYGMDDADAEDVFQNVFAILLRKLDQVQDHQRLSAWLITTTHRECWRLRRAAKSDRMVGLPDDNDPPAAESTPDFLQSIEEQHMIREALATLGDPCRALLEHLFLAPTTPDYRQIADQLGIKVGSIGPTRGRCLEKLRAILIELGWDDPGSGTGE